MCELTKNEIEHVNGGILPLIVGVICLDAALNGLLVTMSAQK